MTPVDDSAATATDAAAPDTARELVIARDMDITSLDPGRAFCDTCQIYTTAVYDTLMTLDLTDPSKQVARLATEWSANDDNTVFTFKLNPAAKFSDGSQVEAKDVKWSWDRLANLKGSGAYLMGGLESIDAPDATTVVATFSAPNSAFLPIVSAAYLGVINSDVAMENGASAEVGADATDTAEPWFLTNSAGSGPYQLESYTPNDSLVFVANENYWGPNKPAFPRITIKQVKDSSSQLQQLQQGDADIAMQISVDALSQLEGDSTVVAEAVDSYNFVYIALSPGVAGGEVFEDVNVRKAIGHAIDYEGAIDALVAGNGKKQATAIPNGFLGAKDLPLPTYDPDLATQLLTEAGQEGGFSVEATYPKVNVYGVDFDLLMQKIQQDLKKVNIDLKLIPLEFAQWVDKIRGPGLPMTAVYFAPDHSDSSQYVQYFGMIPDSSWGVRAGGPETGTPIVNQTEADLFATALAASGADKEKAYTEHRSPDARRRHHLPDRQPTAGPGVCRRRHRHALQRVLQPRPRTARAPDVSHSAMAGVAAVSAATRVADANDGA